MTTSDNTHVDTREMYLVHTMFRREFARLPALVRGVPVGDERRAELIADHIELMGKTLYAHHHSEDEHLWPKLLERCPEEIAPVVHIMEDQHSDIEHAGAETLAATLPWRGTAAGDTGEVLATALDALLRVLNQHMALEEEHVLPVIERYITVAEWQRMADGSGEGIPAEQLPLVLGMMMYEGDPEVLEKTFSRMPEEVRPTMQGLAADSFAEHSVRIHGTATPPRVTGA
jgi:hypothetical protein